MHSLGKTGQTPVANIVDSVICDSGGAMLVKECNSAFATPLGNRTVQSPQCSHAGRFCIAYSIIYVKTHAVMGPSIPRIQHMGG